MIPIWHIAAFSGYGIDMMDFIGTMKVQFFERIYFLLLAFYLTGALQLLMVKFLQYSETLSHKFMWGADGFK
jgi:hypothetical protein